VAGEIDGYFGDMVNTLMLRGKGTDLKVATAICRTTEDTRMFALMASAQSGITSIEDLKESGDWKVATSEASVSEFFVKEILKANGITDPGIMRLPSIPDRMNSLKSGDIDLAILPEPFASQAEAEGAVEIANDKILDEVATVIGLSGSLANDERAKGIVKAYDRAAALINQDPLKYRDILIDSGKISFPADQVDSYKFPTFESSLPTQGDVDSVLAWMKTSNELKGAAEEVERLGYDAVVAKNLRE